jgi:hypothetical protein
MPGALERIERTYDETTSVVGAEFFRRLRDYWELVTTDDKMCRGVREIEVDSEAVNVEFARLDDILVGELRACRDDLVSIDQGTDDSSAERPKILSLEYGTEVAAWRMTLANFDSISGGGQNDIEADGLNDGKSQMLCKILRKKIWYLMYTEDTTRRKDAPPELDGLWDRVVAIDTRQDDAHRELERQLQSLGFLALMSMRVLMTYLQGPPDEDPRNTAVGRWITPILKEAGEPSLLREAVRPVEAVGPIGDLEKAAVAAHEPGARENLRTVQRALESRLEPTGPFAPWIRLWEKDKVAVIGVVTGIVGVVVGVVGVVA